MKKPKSPKRSKKKTLSVQSGRLREDPDKKAKEEEEARIQAEKEEAERKEKEAVEAKERKKREKEEQKKIRAQMPELMATQARINIGLMAVEISKRDSEEWEKFLNPVGPPDPRNLPQINTYLETIEADTSNENISDVLNLCQLFFEFLKTLEISRDMDEKLKAIQYIRTSMDIEEVMRKKINSATHNLLLQAKEQAPHDGDFSSCQSNEWISLCIWANISKNPRVRSIEFEERNVLVEINPFLNRLNCCIRVMFMAEDFASRRITSSKALDNLVLALDNASSHSLASYQSISSTSTSNTSKRSTYDPRVLASAMGIDLDMAYKDRQKNFPKIYIREAKPSHTKVHSARSDDEVDADDAGEDEDEDEELNLNKYNLVTPPGEEVIDEPEPQKFFDLQAYHSIGGVFLIELFHLPYQPKTIKNWTIQMLVDPADVFAIPYDAENTKDRSSVDTKTMPSPLLVSFRLPDNVHIFAEPQLAHFDSEKLKWSRTNFPHKIYNEATRQVSFKIMKFGLMTLMQDSHINMPFRSFTVTPGPMYNSVTMNIVGRLTEVEFVLEGNLICITKPNMPALSDLLNEYMPLCILVKRMKQAGFNFFPGPTTSKLLSIPPKKQGTVNRLYDQLSIFGNQISLKSSVWNVGVNDEEKVVLQVNLNTKNERNRGRGRGVENETFPDELPVEQTLHGWSLMMVSKRQVRILKMQESSETYSDEPIAGFQSNAYALFLGCFDKDVREKLRGTSPMFINNLHTLLLATNPFVLTVM